MLTKDYSMVGVGNYRALGPNPACELFLLIFQTKNGFYTEKKNKDMQQKKKTMYLAHKA